MTNESILSDVESALPPARKLQPELKEKILDAVWQVLTDNRSDDEE